MSKSNCKNIAILTTSRADYSILRNLIFLFKYSKKINFKLIVTGQHLSKKYGKSFYNTSFNEGVNTNTLEIVAKNKIELIEKNDYLISSFNDIDDKKIIYRLNFENKKELQLFKETIEQSDQIEKINTVN